METGSNVRASKHSGYHPGRQNRIGRGAKQIDHNGWLSHGPGESLEQWGQEERVRVAIEIVRRIPLAVQQATTTLDAIETRTQSLMRRIGRPITEALMEAPVPEFSVFCQVKSLLGAFGAI